MTVRELFARCNTYYPYVVLDDFNGHVLFLKESCEILLKCKYLDWQVDFITQLDNKEIRVTIRS